jgi:signal peptidase I
MQPTILEGDRIVVNKVAYNLRVPYFGWSVAEWAQPQHGDVVVLTCPLGVRLVKRVVGLPGDVIEVRDCRLLINGRPTEDQVLDPDGVCRYEQLGGQSYQTMTGSAGPAPRSFGPLVVPEGHYFVMGDYRCHSRDSRLFGFVPGNAIAGRATVIAASLDAGSGYKPRWERFFRKLA